jgi:hypothetical protein
MSLLPSSILSHLFIRFAFTVFVSFVPLVINSFLHSSFIQFFIHSLIHLFFPSLGLSFMPGDWVRLCGIRCSRTGVHVNETISVLGNNNRILGFNTTIRNAPSVAWDSPRTRVILRFAVELIQNWHLQVCWHTNWMSVSLRCCNDKLSTSLDSCSVKETCRTSASAIYLQPHFSSREVEFIGRIVSREWKNVTF